MPDEPLNNDQIEPSSPQPINTMGSESSNMPSEAPESPKNVDIPVSLNNDNPENEPISTPSLEEPKPEELPAEDGKTERISEPAQTPETRTAQIPVNEPLVKISLARELLIKARNMIQSRKRKNLDKIMSLFLQKSKITNDDVEKFLHVSDATAERYLNILEKENKIKQVGKTGHSVSYSRI
jgi:hypothetical protein